MDSLKKINKNYFETLRKRAAKSKVYQLHQSTGLTLAEILRDFNHRSLYMRLAKTYDNNELLRIAKDIAERGNVKNRGAYFMKVLKTLKNQK